METLRRCRVFYRRRYLLLTLNERWYNLNFQSKSYAGLGSPNLEDKFSAAQKIWESLKARLNQKLAAILKSQRLVLADCKEKVEAVVISTRPP
jgi:hypothetical protein